MCTCTSQMKTFQIFSAFHLTKKRPILLQHSSRKIQHTLPSRRELLAVKHVAAEKDGPRLTLWAEGMTRGKGFMCLFYF